MSVGVKIRGKCLLTRFEHRARRGCVDECSRHVRGGLNCVLLNAVPYVIAAGVFQVIVGTLLEPVAPAAVMVTCADALRICWRDCCCRRRVAGRSGFHISSLHGQ